ncbi:MAG: tetratricopeptide repeat protein [candidate division KSB1 bacterium]|nr:tetratricopeptide repeat protein [candidate division KSB1 bacterium]
MWLIAHADNRITEGIQLFEAKKYREAQAIFEQHWQNHPGDALVASYLGRIFAREGNYEQAIIWLEQAVKLDDGNSNYHFWLGQAYGIKAQRAGVLKKASAAKHVQREFERAVALNPDNLEARFGLLQFYLMAPGIMGGSQEKAREQAAEISSRNEIQGHLAYGFIHQMNQEYAVAEKEYRATMALDPKNAQPYHSLGYLYIQQKQYDQAIAVFENLLQIQPEETLAYLSIARVTLMSGKNLDRGEAAVKQFLQVEKTALATYHAYAHFILGDIYKQQAKKDLARTEFEQAVKLNPEFDQAKKALKELDR